MWQTLMDCTDANVPGSQTPGGRFSTMERKRGLLMRCWLIDGCTCADVSRYVETGRGITFCKDAICIVLSYEYSCEVVHTHLVKASGQY